MRLSIQSRRAGFTLIEVMIALAIFAMAAIALATAYVNVLTAYEVAARGTQDDEDFRFARQQLLSIPELKKAEEGQEFEGAGGRKVSWRAEAASTTMPDLFEVTFKCTIFDGVKKHELTETFRLLRPSWSEAADRDKLREEVRQRIQELNAQLAGGTPAAGTGKAGGR